jgi:hypothetical protein
MAYFFGMWDRIADFIREGQEGLRLDTNGNPTNTVRTNGDQYDEQYARSNASFLEVDVNQPIAPQIDITQISRFVNTQAIDDYRISAEDVLNKIDLGGITEKDRLIATDDATGIFSFGLAAPTLYRLVEWYLPDLDILADLDKGSVEQVHGDFYYRETATQQQPNPKQYRCRRQQKGTYDILKNVAGAKLVPVGTDMYATKPTRGIGTDGKEYSLKFGTRNKKIYLKRPKIGGIPPYVDIFVIAGGLADLNSAGMMAKTAPVIMLAQQLEQGGAKVRVYGLRAYTVSGNTIFYSWVAKEYGAPVDVNALAISTADPRFFRCAMWANTEGITRKRYGVDITGYGTTIYGGPEVSEKEKLQKGFNLYKNYLMKQKGDGLLQTKVSDKALFITGGVNQPNNSWNDAQRETIEKEFYRISDIAEVVLSRDKEKAVKRIIKRERENGSTDTEIKNYFRQTIIPDAYYTTNITNPSADIVEYVDSDEYIAEVEEKREKLEQIVGRNLL